MEGFIKQDQESKAPSAVLSICFPSAFTLCKHICTACTGGSQSCALTTDVEGKVGWLPLEARIKQNETNIHLISGNQYMSTFHESSHVAYPYLM